LEFTEKFKQSKFKNLFWFAIATAIFAALLLAADPSKIVSSIAQAKPLYILAAFVTGFMVINCWSLNWYVFFKSLDIDCSYFRTFHVFTAGQFFNNITPLGRFGGQPIMAYLTSKNSGSSYEKSLATVMSADLVTVIPMTLYITTGLAYLTLTKTVSQEVTAASLTLLGFLLTGIFIGFLAWFRPGTIEKYSLKITNKTTQKLGRGEKIHQKIVEKADEWEKTLQTIGKHPKTLLQSLIITGSAFLFRMATFYLILTSLGLQIHPLKIMLNTADKLRKHKPYTRRRRNIRSSNGSNNNTPHKPHLRNSTFSNNTIQNNNILANNHNRIHLNHNTRKNTIQKTDPTNLIISKLSEKTNILSQTGINERGVFL